MGADEWAEPGCGVSYDSSKACLKFKITIRPFFVSCGTSFELNCKYLTKEDAILNGRLKFDGGNGHNGFLIIWLFLHDFRK